MLSEDTMRMEYEDWLLRPHEPSVVKHRFLWDSTMKTQLFKADVNARREQVLVVAGVLCTNVSVRLCVCVRVVLSRRRATAEMRTSASRCGATLCTLCCRWWTACETFQHDGCG